MNSRMNFIYPQITPITQIKWLDLTRPRFRNQRNRRNLWMS